MYKYDYTSMPVSYFAYCFLIQSCSSWSAYYVRETVLEAIIMVAKRMLVTIDRGHSIFLHEALKDDGDYVSTVYIIEFIIRLSVFFWSPVNVVFSVDGMATIEITL